MTCEVMKRGNLEASMYTGRMPCEAEGRNQGDASISPQTKQNKKQTNKQKTPKTPETREQT